MKRVKVTIQFQMKGDPDDDTFKDEVYSHLMDAIEEDDLAFEAEDLEDDELEEDS